MLMIPANKLLNEHLDNIAIALRPVKDFTPNDFPAVKRIEQAIRDKPLEEKWFFDSTGMPIGRNLGDRGSVASSFLDEELQGLPNEQQRFYKKFWGEPAVATHNHPTYDYPQPVGQRYSPLSDNDLIGSAWQGLPIRAVNSEFAGGMVHEFNPGIASHRDVSEILEGNPKLLFNPPAIESALQSKQYKVWNDDDELVPVVLDNSNRPTLRTYSLPQASDIDIPTMATNSFKINRPVKRSATFVQQGDGTYQSFVDGKLYKTLSEDEALAAVDKLKQDDKWALNWKYYDGAGF